MASYHPGYSVVYYNHKECRDCSVGEKNDISQFMCTVKGMGSKRDAEKESTGQESGKKQENSQHFVTFCSRELKEAETASTVSTRATRSNDPPQPYNVTEKNLKF